MHLRDAVKKMHQLLKIHSTEKCACSLDGDPIPTASIPVISPRPEVSAPNMDPLAAAVAALRMLPPSLLSLVGSLPSAKLRGVFVLAGFLPI